MNLKENEEKYVARTYERFNIAFEKGEGSVLLDEGGREYIDLGSGIAVNAFGIADPEWKTAVIAQLENLQHVSNLYYSRPVISLAQALAEKTGFSRFFFSNSGAEANECLIKAARKYSLDKYGEGRYKILSLKGSFHGRTLATLSATGQDHHHKSFEPMPEGFVYAPPDDWEAMERILEGGGFAGVLIEMIQGEGGIRVLDETFVKMLAEYCKNNDVLLLVDEVQTGNGRTGKYFAYEHYGIEPDIVSTAKGLGGGLPLGATGFNEKTKDVLTFGSHGSTFGGNPVSCAGALSVVERMTGEFLATVSEKGRWLKAALTGAKGVKEVSGLGLMIGILPENRTAAQIVAGLQEKGVLALIANDRVRLVPALNISFDLLKKAADILLEVLAG